jgi:hypothetical protein
MSFRSFSNKAQDNENMKMSVKAINFKKFLLINKNEKSLLIFTNIKNYK